MKKFNIGLDFGTYQTKACIYSLENATHEFFRFENGSFFLPSVVSTNEAGGFSYGSATVDSTHKSYTYFKMAAAEDAEFRAETFNKDSGNAFYGFNEFKSYTPEFFSVVYLTFVLLTIKEKYRKQRSQTKIGGLLARLVGKGSGPEDIAFTVQLGIPTEWSQRKNLRRKRKFENILMLSELLQRRYKSLEVFLGTPATQLLLDVEASHRSHQFSSMDEFYAALSEFGLSVYPETAAGLTFVLKTGQLVPGYYAIMDIGGGTTDISFFRLLAGQRIRYLASESYLMAANNVFSLFCGGADSARALKSAEREALEIVRRGASINGRLKKALLEVDHSLDRLVYKLFHRRVYYFQRDIVRRFADQPIILYGGGARLPMLKDGLVEIYDNGRQSLNGVTMEKHEIKRYTSIINVLPKDKSWEQDFSLLVVALGLSYLHSIDDADWFADEDYRPDDGGPGPEKAVVPHPFNEGFYVYDVLTSRWG